uniref:Deoxyribonuclease n=1 Tax=Scleropages formosus TaxID=113540 RepID=A0A8C9W5X8_SCLFO
MRPAFLLWSLVYLTLWTSAQALKICAFNVRSFGETKANNKKVMDLLTKIIARCDLCLVQEVRDAKGEAIPTLVRELNRHEKSTGKMFGLLFSFILSKYKSEIFISTFRTFLSLKVIFQGDTRLIFFLTCNIVCSLFPTVVKDFILVGQHTCPKNAMKEIDELYSVFQEISKKWKNQVKNYNVMFLGDLNAACSYVTAKGWMNVRLRNDPKFHWLIGDEEDTTVRENTRCAYDRLAEEHTSILCLHVDAGTSPFQLEQEALEISDHYPVEVDLKPSHRYLLRNEL